tara:strand:+ start:821 stop:1216 length:396 start_codon:yes stop_codon:yes gene_type:complete
VNNYMAKRKSKVKDTYWHELAGFCILQGYKPAQVAKVLKEVFPHTSVTGRHIGAYKRRMISDGHIVPDRMIMSMNDMTTMAKDLVSKEDMFVYDCMVGSQIQSLKCFEYKLTTEEEDELEKAEAWIKNLKK